ncbi:hypothetical protein [Xanthomonas sp. GPE 39]|uniref:hypothetical protein n=1 Tax=Xanthomonas sp. GPE 39 TaxID=1583099 RepID=UPI0005F2E2A5|nr:hypothetical protein [Xanthomonas sp. GPE 39]
MGQLAAVLINEGFLFDTDVQTVVLLGTALCRGCQTHGDLGMQRARMSPALDHSTRRHAEAAGNQRGGLSRHGRKAVKA